MGAGVGEAVGAGVPTLMTSKAPHWAREGLCSPVSEVRVQLIRCTAPGAKFWRSIVLKFTPPALSLVPDALTSTRKSCPTASRSCKDRVCA